MSDYFVLNDLPDGSWSVSWPGYENNVVNNAKKAMTLLEIMFDHVGVEEAMIGLQRPGRGYNDLEVLHISQIVWFDQGSREHMAKRLAEYIVSGVKFRDQYEAEKFKTHMEQRLAWKRLGGAWV